MGVQNEVGNEASEICLLRGKQERDWLPTSHNLQQKGARLYVCCARATEMAG